MGLLHLFFYDTWKLLRAVRRFNTEQLSSLLAEPPAHFSTAGEPEPGGVRQLAILLVGLILLALPSVGQVPASGPPWQLVAALPIGAPYPQALATDEQGNVFVGGTFYDTLQLGSLRLRSVGKQDGFVAKWNTTTNSFEWAQQIGGPEHEQVTAIAAEHNQVYVVGVFTSDAAGLGRLSLPRQGRVGTNSAFVAKIVDKGPGSDFEWVQPLDRNVSAATALAVQGSSVYVGGNFYGEATFGATLLPDCHRDSNGFVAKFADTGAKARCEWGQPLGVGVEVLAVGPLGLYATGNYSGTTAEFGSRTLPNYGGFNIYIAKMSDAGSTGITEWVQHAGGIEYGWVAGLAVSGSSIYIGGSFFDKTQLFGTTQLKNANHGHGTDMFLVKLTDAGSVGSFTWAQRAGGLGYDEARGLAANETGVYLLGECNVATATFGSCQVPNAGGGDIVVAHLQDAGNSAVFTWAQGLGGTANDAAFSIAVSGAHIYAAGNLATPIKVGKSPFVQGTFIGKLVEDYASAPAPIANAWEITLYPNPSKEVVTVQLPSLSTTASEATLTLYNAQGQAVRRLTLMLPAISSSQQLPISDLSAGVYLLCVQAGNTKVTRRLVVE